MTAKVDTMTAKVAPKLQPFVHYYCPCPDIFISTKPPETNLPEDDEDADLDLAPTLDIDSSRTASSTYPLSRLYFCEDCHQIRCPRCVQDEFIVYYCPNCLFEATTASVKSDKNRCARNCFQCPVCQNTLSVVASSEAPTADPTTTTSTLAGQYYLWCGVCRWDSQEIGMTFEKPTSLAAQLQKSEEALPDVREFDHLKDHFEKFLRGNQTALGSSAILNASGLSSSMMSLNASTTTKPGFPTFSTTAFSSPLSRPDGQKTGDEPGPYTPAVNVVDRDNAVLDEILSIDDADKVSNLTQRFSSIHDQSYDISKIYPQRVHLRIKGSKRCRTCRHILIKPEQKAQTTKFKIKLVAMNYIPTVSIIKPPNTTLPLKLNTATQLVLKFTNPLYEEIEVSLATASEEQLHPNTSPIETQKPRGTVTLLSPQFTVGPYNEVWEYDEELGGTKSPKGGRSKSRSPSRSPKREISSSSNIPVLGEKASFKTPGLWEKKSNFTSVVCEVVPSNLGEFKFPLLITYTYQSEDSDDKMNVDELDAPSTSAEEDKGDGTRSYSFWCIIGLGEVVA